MKNLRRLACKFDLNQSERKSTQVRASPGQTESQVDPSSQLAATCDSVWPGLNVSSAPKQHYKLFIDTKTLIAAPLALVFFRTKTMLKLSFVVSLLVHKMGQGALITGGGTYFNFG